MHPLSNFLDASEGYEDGFFIQNGSYTTSNYCVYITTPTSTAIMIGIRVYSGRSFSALQEANIVVIIIIKQQLVVVNSREFRISLHFEVDL